MVNKLTIILLLILFTFSLNAQKRENIKISGYTKNYDKKTVSGVIISVILNNQKIFDTNSNSDGYFEISLPLQNNYTLEFYKPEYITQKYLISTTIPKNEIDNFYDFKACDVVMLDNFKGLNTSMFDRYFQQIKWDADETSLAFDDEYFDVKIRPAYKNLTNELKTLKKNRYDSLISKGDEKAKSADYEIAMLKYNEASKILPEEKLAKIKINDSKKLLSKTISDEQSYNISIQKGDNLLAENKYADAIQYYEKAILYNPESIVPLEKIEKVEKIQLAEFKKIKNEFDTEIKIADSLYKLNEYDEAWLQYNQALKIIPDETYPAKKINEIKKLTTLDNAYNKAISKADQFFSDKKYENAIKCYMKAYDLKPTETYPTQQINESNRLIVEALKTNATENTKDEAYKNAFSKGLEFLNNNELLKAKEQFTLANDIYPSDKNSKEKINEIDLLIQKQTDAKKQAELIEKQYKESIAKADALFAENKFADSRKEYQKAFELNKNSSYAGNRIEEINKMLEKAREIAQNQDKVKQENNVSKTSSTVTSTEVKKVDTTNSKKITQNDIVKAENNSINNNTVNNNYSVKQVIIEYEKQLETFRKSGNKSEEEKTLNNLGNAHLQQKNRAKALEFYLQSLKLNEQTKNKPQLSNTLSEIALVYLDSGKIESSIDFYEQSLKIKKEIGDTEGEKVVLNDLAKVNTNSFRYEKALDYYSQSLNISEKKGDKSEISTTLTDIGNIYIETKDFEKSIPFLEKSLNLNNEAGNKKDAASTLNNLGAIYYNLGNYKQAEDYYTKSLSEFESIGEKKQTSVLLNNIGNINYNLEKYTKALEFYEKSLKIRREINYEKGIANSLHNIGNVYVKLNQTNKAIDYYNQSCDIAQKINYNEVIAQNYKALSSVYSKNNDFKKAFEYSELYNKVQNSDIYQIDQKPLTEFINKDDSDFSVNKQIEELKNEIQKQKILSQFESSRRLMEIELKNIELAKKEEEYARQQVILYSFILGFILILVFSIMLYRMYIAKRKANVILAIQKEEIFQQKEEIAAQRDEIEQQRDYVIQQRDTIAIQKKEITDSIEYASIIQNSILPPKSIFDNLLNNYFILFKPRDIVSGDFYWITNKHNLTYVVAADCTGHGVPGAFMSMLGVASLNEILNKNQIKLDASNVLNKLRNIVIDSLHQNNENVESKDGMDLSLCVIDKENSQIQYAGAYNPLYIVSSQKSITVIENNEEKILNSELEFDKSKLFEIKGDKMPIGVYRQINSDFSNNIIKTINGDSIYIFSDGFTDQFGGDKGKKYKNNKFKNLILSSSNLPMQDQKEVLLNEFNNWKGNLNQVDDILIIGIKV